MSVKLIRVFAFVVFICAGVLSSADPARADFDGWWSKSETNCNELWDVCFSHCVDEDATVDTFYCNDWTYEFMIGAQPRSRRHRTGSSCGV